MATSNDQLYNAQLRGAATVPSGATLDVVASGLKIGGTVMSATAAEMNVLDGVTAGTTAASKALVVDASKALSDLRIEGTLDLNSIIDQDVALTAAGDAINSSLTINHATAVADGIDVAVAQLTTARTGGVVSAVKASVTSLDSDSGGDYACVQGLSTDGGGSGPIHSFLYTPDAMDMLLKVAASGDGGLTVGTLTAKNPLTDREVCYLTCAVGATTYQFPGYATS